MPTLAFFMLSSSYVESVAYLLYKDEQKKQVLEKLKQKKQEIIETESKEPENVMNLISCRTYGS